MHWFSAISGKERVLERVVHWEHNQDLPVPIVIPSTDSNSFYEFGHSRISL